MRGHTRFHTLHMCSLGTVTKCVLNSIDDLEVDGVTSVPCQKLQNAVGIGLKDIIPGNWDENGRNRERLEARFLRTRIHKLGPVDQMWPTACFCK